MKVVDAGVVLALVLPLPYSDAVTDDLRTLRRAGEELYAPALMEYEACSVLRRAVTRQILTEEDATAALETISQLRIQPISPAEPLHARALAWSARLGHSKAYDAQYLALAEEMGCELLTTDLLLAQAAADLGTSWVKTPAAQPVPRAPS